MVLVGHSGGGAIAHAAVDARPDRIEQVVYVDCGPLGHGSAISDEFPAVGDEIPLPDWSVFGDEELVDLDDDLGARFRASAIPHPTGVATEPQTLSDDRRYDIPATSCLRILFQPAAGVDRRRPSLTAELARIRSVTYVDLPTGHWPQFTKPQELAVAILAAIEG